jgi:dipeptidyl aminopeptidase/acylaminoacyl peptidase
MRVTAAFVTLFSASLSAQVPRPVTPGDYGRFETLGLAALSPDGKWLAYSITRVDEHTELRVRSLTRDTTIAIAMGGSPTFNSNSRWLAFTRAVTPEEREKLEREKKPVRASLGLLDLATLQWTTLGPSSGHRFSGDGRYIAWRAYPMDAAKRDAADLVVRDLAGAASQTFGNVSSFAWSDVAARLAMVIETDGNAGNGVHLFNGATSRLTTLAGSTDRYRGLAWRRLGSDLVVLRSRASGAFRDSTHLVLAWTGLDQPSMKTHRLDPDSGAIPAGLRVTETRVPEWAADGSFVVIGLRPRTPASSDPSRATAAKASDVQVWHAKDVRPIPQQKAQDQADQRRSLAAVWRLAEHRVIQVGSDLMEAATVPRTARYATEALSADHAFGAMFGRPRRDVDVVDLTTGRRQRALNGVPFFLGASPSGRLLAHFQGGQWRVWDAAAAREIPLPRAGAEFANLEDDHPVAERGPYGLAGWSVDEKSLLVYDRYDVWQLATDGSSAARLTNGAPDRLVHRVVRLDPQQPGIDLARPVYLAIAGSWSKQSGFARLVRGTVERLTLGDAQHGRLIRADSAPVLAFVRERFDTPPNWFVGPATLAEARQVSATNPGFAGHAWGKAELVEFSSDSGRRLQGALYYPADYDAGRKYPMIVNTYEIMSNALHTFVAPSQRSYYNRAVWTSQGYFVFTPDVVFRPGDPGRSYLESVIPAVRSVIARGMVDSSRIGLVGHSWGGYEAAYAPTQTNLFATSIAGAPITNFLSFAGAFHWTPGIPEFDHWETGQARMVKPPWEDLAGHLRNSPAAHVDKLQRPMLMMFGDADGTVDWHQGVEFYNFARRAGKEDFVMLVYPGEDHGLRKRENQVDYHRRILEWFGHYLKGDPAAEWMRRGVTWQERKVVQEGAR